MWLGIDFRYSLQVRAQRVFALSKLVFLKAQYLLEPHSDHIDLLAHQLSHPRKAGKYRNLWPESWQP